MPHIRPIDWTYDFPSGNEVTNVHAIGARVYAAKHGQVARLRDGSAAPIQTLTGIAEVRLTASDDGSILLAGTNGHVVSMDPETLQINCIKRLESS